MKTKINQIWEDLENNQSCSDGLQVRRYSNNFLPSVFVGIKSPEKYLCIAALIKSSLKIDISSYKNLRDVNLLLFKDKTKRNFLIISLVNSQHKDVFSVLCEDLLFSISQVTKEEIIVNELISRFEKWKSLFDKISLQGLSEQEQRGLYGELFFLRKFLQNNNDIINVINSWVGCEKQIRDFQLFNWSVEVKTTHGKNHQKVHISSERQLDISHIENIFLYHISLDIEKQSGETLNDIVDSLYKILESNFIALNHLRAKLFEAGYFDHQKIYYEKTGYFVRYDNFYKVENDFPRIEEKDIRNGVGDVKYSIILSQCSNYLINEQQIFKILMTNEQY